MKSLRLIPLVLSLIVAAFVIFPRPAKSYLVQYTGANGTVNRARWDFSDFPVQWNFNPAAASNVSGGAAAPAVVNAAFTSWTTSPNAAIPISRGADTQVSGP